MNRNLNLLSVTTIIAISVAIFSNTFITKYKLPPSPAVLQATSSTVADWPMAGHDPQRTSYAPEGGPSAASIPLWHRQFDYIPSKAHIITSQSANLVFVPTSAGVYALHPDTGATVWFYPTSLPVGHSPAVVNSVVYIPVLDRTIHAVNALTGAKIWQTEKAGAGFTTSPLVVNNTVYAGNRDGFFYAFNAINGSYLWSFPTDAPIDYSAAYHASGKVLFASGNAHAYALRADTGALIWKSVKLPGGGFSAFWPVVYQNVVIFVGETNFPAGQLDLIQIQVNTTGLYYDKTAISGATQLDGARFISWITEDRARQTSFVLNVETGAETEKAPWLWWGNPGGNRYPPVLAGDGLLYINGPWHNGSHFGAGRYIGWKPGSSMFRPFPAADTGYESADEPEAHAIIGNTLYYNAGGDGIDKGGLWQIAGSPSRGWMWSTYQSAFGSYWGNWDALRYGNHLYFGSLGIHDTRLGHHGYQNPPVPLNDKVYFHRSNAVISLKQ